MVELLECHDVARLLNLTPGAVRALARQGKLRPSATTVRGLRLFERATVEALARIRQATRPRPEPAGTTEDDCAPPAG